MAQGILPDSYIIPCVIKACTSLFDLKTGERVHGIALVSGLVSDSYVMSSLALMYVKCDQLRPARKVIDEMPEPDVVPWSALISGYARLGHVEEAFKAFRDMEIMGVEPNLVTWNGMIAGFNQTGRFLESFLVFREMHSRGFSPDGTSVSSVLSAVGDLENAKMGAEIHCCVIKLGCGSDNYAVTALMDVYGKCSCSSEMLRVFDESGQLDISSCNALISGLSRNGFVDEALSIFREFKSKGVDFNVVSWTSVITCCSQNGKDMEALDLFREMQSAGVKPNAVTIPCLLPACGNIAAVMHGKAAHGFSLRTGISLDYYVGSALVDMYAKCGRIREARLCFDRMPSRNLVCWNAMMRGYAMHGKAKEAMDIFRLMLSSGQKPDFISFTCILSACSQSGLTEEAKDYFDSMSRLHNVEARVEHYACMVNLLGRAGKLDEAYSMIEKMPFTPDACVWGALLSACRLHNNLTLGEVAAKQLFELEPKNPGNYILLSNIYASQRRWVDVDRVRNMMKDLGLEKNPGCSWIEVKNKVHMLLAGDKSHPLMKLIIEKLDEISMEMKKRGYAPKVDFVMQDVEEQEKEQILCGHSEKLAVAFGLLNTPPGSPLHVIKNLRICGDCHSVMKFISNFKGREIFVRDTNRFHHFKDGVCSCGDYW